MWPFSSTRPAGPRIHRLSPDFAVSGQIFPADMSEFAKAGIKTIICARPDGEESGQPDFAVIALAAKKAGIETAYIPVSGGVGEGQLIHMESALRTLPLPMLAYCRSGARAGALFSAARAFRR